MPLWLQIIIVASTFAGLLFAGFGIWVGFKERQTQLSTSASELERTVAAQQKALETAVRRIQNLEAIVSSPTWDTVQDDALLEVEAPRVVSPGRLHLDALEDEEPSDAEHVARIARRLKT